MRYLIVLAAIASALAASATASAGGWATVGFAPLPTGIGPGDTWNPEITVLQHGVTPLDGLTPTVTIEGDAGAETFTAIPTGEPGVYEASVVFPQEGSWGITIESGFGASNLTYGPVTITDGGGAGAVGSDDFPVLPLVAVLGGLVLAAVAAFGVLRQRRLTPAR
jgi:hypothetical protein